MSKIDDAMNEKVPFYYCINWFLCGLQIGVMLMIASWLMFV